MKIHTHKQYLGIDTVTEQCSIAVSKNNEIQQWVCGGSTQHSRHLLQMIDDGLKQSGILQSELDGIVVNVGPGSFSGVRIGLGVAQGMAYAQGLKVFPVSSLKALCYAAHKQFKADFILPALDARMQQVYWSLFAVMGEKFEQLIAPLVQNPEQVFESYSYPDEGSAVIGVGNGWEVYGDKFDVPASLKFKELPTPISHPEAKNLIEIAQCSLGNSWINPIDLQAFYIRNRIAEKSASIC